MYYINIKLNQKEVKQKMQKIVKDKNKGERYGEGFVKQF